MDSKAIGKWSKLRISKYIFNFNLLGVENQNDLKNRNG